MHPAIHAWWRARHEGACGDESGCGPRFSRAHMGWRGPGGPHPGGGGGDGDELGGGAFGVRRPLRYLAHKLELDDAQVAEVAKIIADLKTERAQAAVDERRTVSALADAVAGETFDAARAAEGGALRVKSAERLREAVLTALGRIHALLSKEQREHFAHLLRTGALGV